MKASSLSHLSTLSPSSCFLLLSSRHHQSLTSYLSLHPISQNLHWLDFLNILVISLPYFLSSSSAELIYSCAVFLPPSTLCSRGLCLGWEGCVCVCVRACPCASTVGRVFWGSLFTCIVPVTLAASFFLVYWHPVLKCGRPCWSMMSPFDHSQDHLSHCPGPPWSLADAVGFLISRLPRRPFAAEPVRGSQALSPRVLCFLQPPQARCGFWVVILGWCRGAGGDELRCSLGRPHVSARLRGCVAASATFSSQDPKYAPLPLAISSSSLTYHSPLKLWPKEEIRIEVTPCLLYPHLPSAVCS